MILPHCSGTVIRHCPGDRAAREVAEAAAGYQQQWGDAAAVPGLAGAVLWKESSAATCSTEMGQCKCQPNALMAMSHCWRGKGASKSCRADIACWSVLELPAHPDLTSSFVIKMTSLLPVLIHIVNGSTG